MRQTDWSGSPPSPLSLPKPAFSVTFCFSDAKLLEGRLNDATPAAPPLSPIRPTRRSHRLASTRPPPRSIVGRPRADPVPYVYRVTSTRSAPEKSPSSPPTASCHLVHLGYLGYVCGHLTSPRCPTFPQIPSRRPPEGAPRDRLPATSAPSRPRGSPRREPAGRAPRDPTEVGPRIELSRMLVPEGSCRRSPEGLQDPLGGWRRSAELGVRRSRSEIRDPRPHHPQSKNRKSPKSIDSDSAPPPAGAARRCWEHH